MRSFSSSHFPTISIVVPSYNQGAFIGETLDSLFSQNYPALEVVVIDGGSNDNSQAVIAQFENHLKYWHSKPDRGQSDAINTGLKQCGGKLFNWINSDDTMLPGSLSLIAERYQALSDIEGTPLAVSGRTITTDALGVRLSDYAAQIPKTQEERLTQLRINQPGTFLPLDIAKSVGGVREDLNFTMDLDLYLRVFLHNPILRFELIGSEVATYRLHSDSKTCSTADAFAVEEFAIITDLCSQICGVGNIPTGVSAIRSRIEVPSYPHTLHSDFNHQALLASYFKRLVFSDNLLARCGKQMGLSGAEISETLSEILATTSLGRPTLKSEILAHDQAALGALWAAGSLDPSLIRLYLKGGVGFRKLRELLRLI